MNGISVSLESVVVAIFSFLICTAAFLILDYTIEKLGKKLKDSKRKTVVLGILRMPGFICLCVAGALFAGIIGITVAEIIMFIMNLLASFFV
jgi:hypothetical protein